MFLTITTFFRITEGVFLVSLVTWHTLVLEKKPYKARAVIFNLTLKKITTLKRNIFGKSVDLACNSSEEHHNQRTRQPSWTWNC